MKILQVIASANPAGGGPIEGLKQMAPVLTSMGHAIELATLDDPADAWLSELPFPIHALGPSRMGYGYTAKAVAWLRRRRNDYDAVIVRGIWGYHSFAVWRALKGAGTPYYVFPHGMLDPWFKERYPLKHIKKWLYWPWAEYRVLRDAHAVIFTCEEERLVARRSFWLYRANEKVTNYGTAQPPENADELQAAFVEAWPSLRGKRIVLFMGRLHEKKGCDLLLEAFACIAGRDPTLHLLMAGPDQTGLRGELERLAERHGIAERVTWPGMLEGAMKWGAFNAAEVFCLPSHQENFGIVVAEALACGKPVLISDKVNIWREIEADAAGFVETDSVEGTVSNLQRWLALDESGYQRMTANARRCFRQRFHIERAAERLIEILNEFAR